MNSNNWFGSETVDDDEFLRHPRSGSGYMLSNQYNQLGHNQGRPQPPPQPSPAQSNNSLEQQRQVRTQKSYIKIKGGRIAEWPAHRMNTQRSCKLNAGPIV